MAGRIRDDDIAEVREKARIDEVVSQYVTLRNAGGGSLKGLCPFHDEKSPSFNVNPQPAVLPLLRLPGGRRRHHLPDEDRRAQLRRGGRAARRQVRRPAAARGRRRPATTGRKGPQRGRLIEANQVAQEFYADQLGDRRRRGRRASSCTSAASTRTPPTRFGIGFAPRDGEALLKHLRAAGLQPTRRSVAAGLVAIGPVGVRPVPRPPAVADPRRQRRHDRLRRAPDLRRRQDRGEVPQHPRDARSTRRARCSTASTWPGGTWRGRRRRSWSRATPT